MTTQALASAGSATARAAARLLILAIYGPFQAALRSARIRRTELQLQELDDRTLADIGLRRTQIISTAAHVVDRPQVDPRRLAR